VTPQGRMRDIAAQQTGYGGSGTEEYALAAVVSTSETWRAGVAGNTWLDRNAITRL
jgi:hypothetical protein